jgi:hypothetical protein
VLLGIEPLLSEIAANSEPFDNSGISETSAKQKSSAMASCVATFAWAVDTLEWFVAQVDHGSAPGPEKELAQALLASLVHLSARHALTPRAKVARDARASRVH